MNREDFFFYSYNGTEWEGLKRQKYKDLKRGWKGVSRYVFSKAGTIPYEVRYFEVEGKGYTSLEKHNHQHVVIGAKGSGYVIVGKRVIQLKTLDVLLISSWTPHQFINPNKAPFGFFCIVEGERDRPKRLEREEIRDLMKNEEIRSIIKLD